MRIDILTLFPAMFSPLEESMIGKAKGKGILKISVVDIRNFSTGKHRTADDSPCGGGAGMVIKPELIIEAVASTRPEKGTRVILLTPSGQRLDQAKAKELARSKHIVLICGHYEGIDQRAVDEVADEEISIGDYVLTGGELPAMVLIDTLARFIPGVLGDQASSENDSFSNGLLEYPQYTKPADREGSKVPEVLLSGDHKKIAGWRRAQSIRTTFFKRPDLLAKAGLDGSDIKVLEGVISGGK